MNNNKLIVFVLMLAGIVNISGYTKTKEHSNILYMHRADDSETFVNFIVDTSCITDKQPYNGVFPGKDYIKIMAGRKSSKKVANCFKSWVGDSQHSIFHFNPTRLNFAVKGTLEVSVYDNKNKTNKKIIFNNMAVAQGRNGAANNWWIGGKNCTYSEKGSSYFTKMMDCQDIDKNNWCFQKILDRVSTIFISLGKCDLP